MICPPASSRSSLLRSSIPQGRLFTGILFIALIVFISAGVMPVSAGPGVFAAFSADPMSGTVPLEVHFTDTSCGANSWSWSFDDGSSATQQNPVHTFTEPGDYDVSLTINGGESTANKTITVTAPILYSGGSGTEADPYLISNSTDIITLSTDSANWGKNFTLTADISLAGGSPTYPIGNSKTTFTGNFDGQGYTISDFTMNQSSSDNIGLFGCVGSGAGIRNLGVSAGDDGVHGNNYVGVLAGYTDGSITNCAAAGNVTAGIFYAGGLVGKNSGTIATCSAAGTVTADNAGAGGLVGYNYYGIITNCSAAGAVTAIAGGSAGGLAGSSYLSSITKCSATGSATSGDRNAGGLVGYAYCGSITNCYATGSAVADSLNAGGLVGHILYCSIVNCYATGSATAENTIAGGLVGLNIDGSIANSYATGSAAANSHYNNDAGGLVGSNSGTITNCYRHYNGGMNYDGTYISDLTTFRDIAFLTGYESDTCLNWSTDIISTDADPSKIWRAFTYKGQYPIFQWQSYDTGSVTVTSSPADADISLNGVATGRVTDTTLSGLPEGEYTVAVSREGYDATPENVSVTLTGGGTEEVSFVLIEDVTILLNLSAGWNMISVPARDATVTVSPAACAGAVYRYNGNIYESVPDLESVAPGEGLWMAATGPCTITFTGLPLENYTQPASAGWNMIGSCSEEIASFGDHLSSDPAGAVSGQIYGYDPDDGRYETPVSCSPGCGYWVSVTEDCDICLS